MVVIVVLVNGEDDGSRVDDGNPRSEDFPYQPVIPVSTADGEGRQVRAIEAAREGEVVYPIRRTPLAGAGGEVAELGLPGGAVEGPGRTNIDVGALADHEEFLMGGRDGTEGAAEIIEEENVAIDVANGVVAGELLGFEEDGMEEDGAEFVAFDVGLVTEVEFAGDFGGAGVSAEEDDFDIGVEAHPGLDGVALDDVDVPFEGFRDGEEGQHLFRIAKRSSERFKVLTSEPLREILRRDAPQDRLPLGSTIKR